MYGIKPDPTLNSCHYMGYSQNYGPLLVIDSSTVPNI